VEEFVSRISEFADILKNLQVPGVPGMGGHPIARLAEYLRFNLPEINEARVISARDVLSRVITIRNGLQHYAAQSDAAKALADFGIAFPVVDWTDAWEVIRIRGTEAIDVIRDEILAQTPDVDNSG
jgi:hypothetical protein